MIGSAVRLLRCAAEALVAKGLRGLLHEVPLVGFGYDLACDVWNRVRDQARSDAIQEIKDGAAGIAAAPDAEFEADARKIADEVAKDNPEVRDRLADTLVTMQGRVRATFRRPDDPSGKSSDPAWMPERADDLVAIVPIHVPAFRPGDKVPGLPKWILDRRLGLGGFGETWLAHRASDPTDQAAFKFCVTSDARVILGHEKAVLDRVRKLDLPGVVRLDDYDLDDDTPWLKYQFVAGGELTRLVVQFGGKANAAAALKCWHDLATTVGQCHESGVIHRDLKPANVLLAMNERSKVERLKVTDFGIGKVTAAAALAEERVAVGAGASLSLPMRVRYAHTVLYASPQQKEGRAPTSATTSTPSA